MRRSGWVLVLVSLLVVAFVLPTTFQGAVFAFGGLGGGEKKAVSAAQTWLEIVDRGAYAKSWNESATMFQGAVPQDTWVTQMKGVRAPLGKATSRKVISAKRYKELPGAPDGDYVVVQFQTSFAGKKNAVETVTPMMDGSRGWRVSGYYIK